jgi:putative membrane protein
MKTTTVMTFLLLPWLVFAAPAAQNKCAPQNNNCNDPYFVAEAKAANAGEVLVAESVLPRLATESVRAFAQQMITEHTATNAMLLEIAARNGITPVESEISLALTAHAMQEVEMLAPLAGLELDRAYMDGQILDHETTLMHLDTRWIPGASNPELKAFFVDMRAHVVQHLEEARAIRAQLGLTVQ